MSILRKTKKNRGDWYKTTNGTKDGIHVGRRLGKNENRGTRIVTMKVPITRAQNHKSNRKIGGSGVGRVGHVPRLCLAEG